MNRGRLWLASISALLVIVSEAQAQHEDHAGMIMPGDSIIPPMERMGSGTTWIPDASVIPSLQGKLGSWDWMFHGLVFVQYNKQSGPRGAEQFGSSNWAMIMASHSLAGGRFQFRTMLSLDPATIRDGGYPLLLQTGETYQGQPLIDRQHPHDFWMELGALYERALSPRFAVFGYVAPSGEPALGPVAFMHRPSAFDDPVAPLSHHWQDATHISFGVVTLGAFGRKWKLEGSVFNGREPDEARWGFDNINLDSYSGRVTVNPDAQLSLTAGYGYLNEPEALHPGSVHRAVVSALYGRKLGDLGQIAVSAVWGANKHGDDRPTHSALLEGEAIIDARNTIFARTEVVQKSSEELGIAGADQTFNVAAASLGYIREIVPLSGGTVGLGARVTINFVPGDLSAAYGSTNPTGALVFLRVRPKFAPAMTVSSMKGMSH
jgi:hypothetical protein